MTAGAERDTYRILTAAAVLLVAAIAAAISFLHIESLAVRYGQPVLAAYLLPVSIDGTVAVSSLALLRSARAGISSPWLARTGLVLSVGATIACNVGYGLAHGLPGALLSGWPAVAFIVSAETAIGMSRRTRSASAPVPEPVTALNGHAAAAAEAFAADLAEGRVPGIRAIRSGLHIGQDKASQVQAWLRTQIQ
jgi:hypothetical protein